MQSKYQIDILSANWVYRLLVIFNIESDVYKTLHCSKFGQVDYFYFHNKDHNRGMSLSAINQWCIAN